MSGEDAHRDLCSTETSTSKRMAHCEDCCVSRLCSSDTKKFIVKFLPPSADKSRRYTTQCHCNFLAYGREMCSLTLAHCRAPRASWSGLCPKVGESVTQGLVHSLTGELVAIAGKVDLPGHAIDRGLDEDQAGTPSRSRRSSYCFDTLTQA